MSDSCRFVDLRALSDEGGSIVYNCCWPSPAQSFSGANPVRLVAIFYCLRYETSLFVASYGGGIRPRLHTGRLQCGWFPHHPSPRRRLTVAQLLKRAGKSTWRPERVVSAMGGGGAAGVASAAGLKVVVVVPRP
jgi:hypothetical protein